jgi:hypothetical protein
MANWKLHNEFKFRDFSNTIYNRFRHCYRFFVVHNNSSLRCSSRKLEYFIDSTCCSEKGASYGGEGGSNTGTTYGSTTSPSDAGSGCGTVRGGGKRQTKGVIV